jgi:hypothetical protein
LPLTADIDPAYFNSAPPDQQLTTIRVDERIFLENLHADHPALERKPPTARARRTPRAGGCVPVADDQ